jgi:hypothetical protein
MFFETTDLPFSPATAPLPGVFRMDIGTHFFFGCGTEFAAWREQQLLMLDSETHPNPMLTSAWNDVGGSACDHGVVSFALVHSVTPKGWDESDDGMPRAKFILHNTILKFRRKKTCCNRCPAPSDASTRMKEKWQDPTFRAAQSEIRSKRCGDKVSAETRSKLSASKSGGSNPSARKCVLHFQGVEHHFPCGSDAARHFGVTQQVMDIWLKGICPWPGTGLRAPRGKGKELIGLTGSYLG